MTRAATRNKFADFPSDATRCDLTTDKKAAKALAHAKEKHAHLVPTAIFRAADGRRLPVKVRCSAPGCAAERVVATSDVFRTRTCVAHGGRDDGTLETTKFLPPHSNATRAPSPPNETRANGKGTLRSRRARTMTPQESDAASRPPTKVEGGSSPFRIGIPYHDQRLDGSRAFSICPFCGKEYPMVRRDFESFLMTKEAITHADTHEEATGRSP